MGQYHPTQLLFNTPPKINPPPEKLKFEKAYMFETLKDTIEDYTNITQEEILTMFKDIKGLMFEDIPKDAINKTPNQGYETPFVWVIVCLLTVLVRKKENKKINTATTKYGLPCLDYWSYVPHLTETTLPSFRQKWDNLHADGTIDDYLKLMSSQPKIIF